VVEWATTAPRNPRAWLFGTARHKAIDRLRQRARFALSPADVEDVAGVEAGRDETPAEEDAVPDERLRLIFTCCHPALAAEAQVALTLRTLCGLTTEEIARAFLVPATTMAQRLVRAKAKIRQYEGELPIFEHYEVERQIEEAFRRRVYLKSGGYVVFDETEALIAIDVNTGRHKGEGSQEDGWQVA